jgi:hypothetical protein
VRVEAEDSVKVRGVDAIPLAVDKRNRARHVYACATYVVPYFMDAVPKQDCLLRSVTVVWDAEVE